MLQTIEHILRGVSGIIALLCSALAILLVLRAACYSRKMSIAWKTMPLGRKLITWFIGSWLYYILLALFLMFLALVFGGYAENAKPTGVTTNYNNSAATDSPQSEQTYVLPRLVDLGASKCIPCKMMAPILEELKNEYKGRLKVVFIDVWKNKNEASKYNIKIIPTQIFYNADGKELFRHEGFFAKEDILAKWKELGFELEKTK